MSTDIEQESGREIRLPTNLRPLNYQITIETSFVTLSFAGHVDIELHVIDSTQSIKLHAAQVEVDNVSLKTTSGHSYEDLTAIADEDDQTITIALPEQLKASDNVILHLEFNAPLQDSLEGFFRAKHKNASGEDALMAATQLAPIAARTVFPCFDEPALKANFDLTLIVDSKLTALSNMGVKFVKELDLSRKSVTFERTPLMSTYLLAFAVGEFHPISTDSFRVPVNLYTTPDQNPEQGRWALDLAVKTLELFEATFGLPYPLPKLDLITCPDFLGAMENWGLVIFTEHGLLLDEESADATSKQGIAGFIIHELAHQWFGNLVTMDYWDGLWLNEGFATWTETYGMKKFFPEWQVEQDFLAETLQPAMQLDSLRNSHPIDVPILDPTDIDQIFDDITYQKGSCVLRMISQSMGEDKFLKAVTNYLQKHVYGNTKNEELWNALAEVSGQDVRAQMNVWTQKVGYPVLIVEEKGESLLITQHRFIRTGDVQSHEDETIYPVDLSIRLSDGSVKHGQMLLQRSVTLPAKEDFIKINADCIGMYRTLYSSERLSKFANSRDVLSTEDRAGIIADATALASAGLQSTADLMTLLYYFRDETDYIVWLQILSAMDAIDAAFLFQPPTTRANIQAFRAALVHNAVRTHAWTFHPHEPKRLQTLKTLLFKHALLAHDPTVLTAAREMFTAYQTTSKDALHPNLRPAVFTSILSTKPSSPTATAQLHSDYDFLLSLFHSPTTSREDRDAALRALGFAQSPDLIARTLELALSEHVKKQEFDVPLQGLMTFEAGARAVWEWIRTDWERVQDAIRGSPFAMQELLNAVLPGLGERGLLEEVVGFFEGRDTRVYEKVLGWGLDEIRVKVNWVERGRGELEGWFEAHGRELEPYRYS